MDIKAADLDAYGSLKSQSASIRKRGVNGHTLWIRPLRPVLEDALIENGSILYGFSAAEFAALIILCGFCPGDFAPQSLGHSTSYYGQIEVADYGQFSQVAKYSHHGFRDAAKSFRTDMRDVLIAHCLDLAFGIIPIRGRGGREWFIPHDRSTGLKVQSHELSTNVWSGYALPQQLISVRYSFERFAATSQLDIANYSQSNEAFDTEDIRVLQDLMSASGFAPVSRSFNSCSQSKRSPKRHSCNSCHSTLGFGTRSSSAYESRYQIDLGTLL